MSAKGIVSGRARRIVIGWSQLSNWAARMRYMKMNDRAKARRKFCAARPCSLDRPMKRYV